MLGSTSVTFIGLALAISSRFIKKNENRFLNLRLFFRILGTGIILFNFFYRFYIL